MESFTCFFVHGMTIPMMTWGQRNSIFLDLGALMSGKQSQSRVTVFARDKISESKKKTVLCSRFGTFVPTWELPNSDNISSKFKTFNIIYVQPVFREIDTNETLSFIFIENNFSGFEIEIFNFKTEKQRNIFILPRLVSLFL